MLRNSSEGFLKKVFELLYPTNLEGDVFSEFADFRGGSLAICGWD